MRYLLACTVLLLTSPVLARPFVTVRDDGTIQNANPKSLDDFYTIENGLIDAYKSSGKPVPSFISVWSAFPYGKNTVGTQYFPIFNEVKGIGLENEYGGDGTVGGGEPGLIGVMMHNDVRDMAARAMGEGVPVEGFGSYLFLLELSHTWGPAPRLPTMPADQLMGFPFHWSFWLDAGRSPAGGNLWKDNGDGTFTTQPQTPSTVAFSPLDLYLMGLGTAAEVQPFGILENPVPPTDVMDPFGGPLTAQSFPWFGANPVTVKATRRTIKIDDIVATNGMRSPAAGASPTHFTLGIMLLLGKDTADAEAAAVESSFAPLAASLAPAFSQATGGRGTLDVVSEVADPVMDGGVDSGMPPEMGHGCTVAGGRGTKGEANAFACVAFILGCALLLRRRARA